MSPESVIAEAKRWVGDWEFTPIRSVTWLPKNELKNGEKIPNGVYPALWWGSTTKSGKRRARITFNWDQDNRGLWHEVFHSAADQAPLLKVEPLWKEGWCCAFSEVMRQEFSPKNLRWPGTGHDRIYGWACASLVNYASGDATELRTLWLAYNALAAAGALGPKTFSILIGYDPETGEKPS